MKKQHGTTTTATPMLTARANTCALSTFSSKGQSLDTGIGASGSARHFNK